MLLAGTSGPSAGGVRPRGADIRDCRDDARQPRVGATAQAAEQGVIVPSSPTDLMISSSDLVPNPTTTGALGLNLDSRDTVPALPFLYTDPTTYNSSTAMTVYDSLGNSHVMSLYFRKTAANTWQVYTGLDGAAPAPAAGSTMTFTSAGAVNTGGTVGPPNECAASAITSSLPNCCCFSFAGTKRFCTA